MFTSTRRLYLNADRTKVVEEGDPEAAYLLVGEGGQIPQEEADKYGLSAEATQSKAVPKPPATKGK